MRLKLMILMAVGGIAASCSTDYTEFVDTKIGTGGHGHVFVGANVPFGMVQLGPTSIPQEWDWCSGYHESDSTVIGFSHTHLSGTGIGDLFDITVMPVIDNPDSEGNSTLTFARGKEDDPATGLWSYADRTKEITRPGYYAVPLTRYDVYAEMTATNRVGLHRYTFPASENAAIVFDLQNGGCWDRPMNCMIQVADPQNGNALEGTDTGVRAIRGYRYSRGWADNQKIYFYAEFSKPAEKVDIISRDVQIWSDSTVNMPLFAKVGFKTQADEKVMVKVGLSSVSMDGAYRNMKAEAADWKFDSYAKNAKNLWNKELGKIDIQTKDESAKRIFYTALYHAMIAPSVFSDVDGSYRGADGETYSDPGYTTLTTFSLWDTYRAAMPLYSIFQSERYSDMISTMLGIFREQGKLPVWHLHGCETNCMVGNPGIIPVADAIVKKVDGLDVHAALEAMTASALIGDRGQDVRMKYGYIPYDLFNESVAYDLEYALADAAIANAAKRIIETSDDTTLVKKSKEAYDYFSKRSQTYKELFDKELGFIRGKDSKGNFRKEYSPYASKHRADDYCEGNGWQYTWLVPHDIDGLMECFGGNDAFIQKLDSLFTVPSIIEGEETSPDISGLIGQYAHGNEPSHHILYFYTLAGEPWKGADKIREVLKTLYKDTPDGLSGNEDVGQMSSWYILSSLGFYPVEPGSGEYVFGSPIVDRASIQTEAGVLEIEVIDNSKENKYIQSITLNGAPYEECQISHEDIAKGGKLVIQMGAEPAKWY